MHAHKKIEQNFSSNQAITKWIVHAMLYMRHPKDISVTVTSIAGLGVPTSDVEETERICVPAVIVRLTNKLPRVLR